MEQTATQYLREDLLRSIISSTEALEVIDNEKIRLVCQEIVRLTLMIIIERIDEEFLEMEKQQIVDAFYKGIQEQTARVLINAEKTTPEQYYEQRFNK